MGINKSERELVQLNFHGSPDKRYFQKEEK